MQAFDVLGNAVRRRIVELLAERSQPSGAIVEVMQREFDISQPGVSQHLGVLRDAGFVTARVDGQRRVYELASAPFDELEAWLGRFRGVWERRLDALATEVARGKRERRGQRSKDPVRRRA